MTAERQQSALVSRRRINGDVVRHKQFPTQLLAGYSPDAVNAFMGQVAGDCDWLYEQLEEANERAVRAEQAAGQATRQFPAQVAVPAMDHTDSLRLLRAAQESADKAVADARRTADDILEHARQQADRILTEARQHAAVSGRQIIDEATADSRRQVARNLVLAEKIRAGLHQGASTLEGLLGEWAKEAGPEVTDVVHREPAEEAPAVEAPATRPARARAQKPAPAADE